MGPRMPETWADSAENVGFFDVKGDLEAVFALTGDAASFTFSRVDHPVLDPGQSAQITRHGRDVGLVGRLHPQVLKRLGLSEAVYVFELELEPIYQGSLPLFDELSKFPEMRRDIAIIVDKSIISTDICGIIRETAGDYLQNLMLFDVYMGKGIDPARKSIALGLTFQHPSRNLTDQEVTGYVDRVVVALRDQIGATLRM